MAVSLIGIGATVSGARKDRKAAAAAQASADQRAGAALAFSQEQYDDWKAIYGPLQDNLAEYYNNMSANSVETQAITAIEEERNQLLDRINTNFAQRGIEQSGIAAATNTEVEINTSQQRAQARANAPMIAAQQRSQFLNAGLGLNPSNQVQGALNNNAANSQQLANNALAVSQQSSNAAGQAIGELVGGTKKAFVGGSL